MDVLRPPLVYIGNRCYRKNPVSSTTNTAEDDYEDDELGYRDGILVLYINLDLQSTAFFMHTNNYISSASVVYISRIIAT